MARSRRRFYCVTRRRTGHVFLHCRIRGYTMMDMTSSQSFADRHRGSFLALVMLGILLASVAAAQLLADYRGASARRGADIMASIRSQSLQAYWKDDSSRQWYLLTNEKGEAVGYREAFRRRTHGGFTGITRLVIGNDVHLENWQLSSDTAKGRYKAVSQTSAGGMDRTDINFDSHMVTVVKRAADMLGQVQQAAPDNYVPEGMLPLAIAEATKSGRATAFKVIDNEQAIVEGMLYYSLVTVSPNGPREARVEYVRLGDNNQAVYRFDDQGTVIARDYDGGNITEKLVSFPEIRKAFGELDKSEDSQPTPAEPTQPDVPDEQDDGNSGGFHLTA